MICFNPKILSPSEELASTPTKTFEQILHEELPRPHRGKGNVFRIPVFLFYLKIHRFHSKPGIYPSLWRRIWALGKKPTWDFTNKTGTATDKLSILALTIGTSRTCPYSTLYTISYQIRQFLEMWSSASGDQAIPSAMVAALKQMKGTQDIRDQLIKHGFAWLLTEVSE